MSKRLIAIVCTALTIFGVMVFTPNLTPTKAYMQQQKCGIAALDWNLGIGHPGWEYGWAPTVTWTETSTSPLTYRLTTQSKVRLLCDHLGAVACRVCYKVTVLEYNANEP